MSLFEDFVNLELPRRPVMLTRNITSYDGDPNGVGAPQILQVAPQGSFFLQDTGKVLWKKNLSDPGTWENVTTGTTPPAASASSLQSSINWECPAAAIVGDVVYISGNQIVGLACAADLATMPAYGLVVAKTDATHCTVLFQGEFTPLSGLTPGSYYYVDPVTPGKLTETPPDAPGQVVQRVLQAITPTLGNVIIDGLDYFVQS